MAWGHNNWYQSYPSPAMAESTDWYSWNYGIPPGDPPPNPNSPQMAESSSVRDYWSYGGPPMTSSPSNRGIPTNFQTASSWNPWSYGDPPPISSSDQGGFSTNTPGAYSYSRNQGYGFYQDLMDDRFSVGMDVGGSCIYETETFDRARSEREGIRVLADDVRQEGDSASEIREQLMEIANDLRRRREKMIKIKASIGKLGQELESTPLESSEAFAKDHLQEFVMTTTNPIQNDSSDIKDLEWSSQEIGEVDGEQTIACWASKVIPDSLSTAMIDAAKEKTIKLDEHYLENHVKSGNREGSIGFLEIPRVCQVLVEMPSKVQVLTEIGDGNIVGKIGSAEVKLTVNEILGSEISVEMNAFEVFEEMPTKNLVLFGSPADLKDGARLRVHVDPVNEDSNETVHRLVDQLKTMKSSKIISDLMVS